MMGMRYTKDRKYLTLVAIIFLFFLTETSYAQSGQIKIDIRVDSLVAYLEGGNNESGDYEYRFDIWLDDNELQLEMSGVKRLPAGKAYKTSNTNTTYRIYKEGESKTLSVKFEGWEEDGIGDNDNEYNSNNDDAHCKTSKGFSYNDRAPGMWHKGYILECQSRYKMYYSYRWSPPKPPKPTSLSEEICRGEETEQFEVPVHKEKRYAIRWDWQKVRWSEDCDIVDTCDECDAPEYDTEDKKDLCLKTCRTGDCKDVLVPSRTYEDAGEILTYKASEDKTELVRYRQWYSSTAYSDWSEPQIRNYEDHYYDRVKPASIATYEYGSDTETNLICGTGVKLRAVHPNGEEWKDHRFYWYREIEGVDTQPVLIRGGERGSTYDGAYYTIPAEMEGKRTYFSVQTRHEECQNRSDTVRTGTIFLFKPVPPSFTVSKFNVGRIRYEATSCADAKDGKITIRARADETDRYFYYNIALKNSAKPNGIEPTSILSSPKIRGDETFTFPDNISYPGDKTGFSEEEWRNHTRITAGTYVVQVINGGDDKEYELDQTFNNEGYCFKKFEIEVKSRPELTIRGFSPEKEISCYKGEEGEISVRYRGGRAPYRLQLFKGSEEDFVANGSPAEEITINSTSYTFENLPTGHYKVRITLSNDVCWKETENSVYLDQPAALSLADENVTRSTDDATYHDAWITCPGANDAYLEVSPQGGNLARNYTATLYKDDVEQTSETFTEAHRFANLSPGQYKIIVEDVCATNAPVSSKTFDIYEPLPLIIDSVRTAPITCYGVPNGQITMSSREGTGTRQFKIDDGDWDNEVNEGEEFPFPNLDSGWHEVQVRDINGCTAPAPFRFHLKYPSPLNFELDSLVMPLCHGGSDGKLFIRPFGGDTITQEYKVSIRPVNSLKPTTSRAYKKGDAPLLFDSLSFGYYEVTVHDTDVQRYDCSPIVDTVFLPQPDLITVNTVQVTKPSCEGATDGAVHVKATKGTPGEEPPYYYAIIGPKINEIVYVAPREDSVAVFEGLEAGDYTFYAIDGHHEDYETPAFLDETSHTKLCTGTLTFTLTEPERIEVYYTKRPVTCYGTATGGITIDDVTGGWGIYTYAWSVRNPTANTYRTLTPADPKNLSEVPAGTYRLVVSDTAECTSTTTEIEVTQPARPLDVTSVPAYPESCPGTADGKLQVLAQGGYPPYTYQIDGGAYQTQGLFEKLAAGAYLLTVRDQRGCEARRMATLTTDEPTVTVADQLPATVGFQDGLLRLNVTGGKNKDYYLDGVLSTTGAEFSGLAAGEHTVAITYNGQCRWEQTYTIDEVAAPVPALRVTTQSLHNVSCSEANDGRVSVNVMGGVAPYVLQWNDSQRQTTSEAIGLAKGIYSLTVTDAAEVTLDYPVTVDGPEPLEVINTVAASPACHQGADGSATVTVVGGTAPYTYAWNDDQRQTTARANSLTAGTYSVTVTDHNGCTLTQEITIEPTSAPADVLEPQAITLCTGQLVTVDAGAEWSTYRWTADNGFSSTAQRIDINQAGRYFLRVTNSRGCAAYDTLDLVTTDNLIDAEFLLPTEIAAGDTVVLTEVSWPAPDQTTWLYDQNVTTHESDGEKEYVIFSAPGEYSVTLVVMVGACMDRVEKKIIVSERSAAVSTSNGRLGYVPKNEYLIYPNPSHGTFTLKVNTSRSQRVRVSVYDPLFKYRYHQQTFADTRSLEEAMDLTHLKHGVYTLMIETADEIKLLRFVIR